MKHRVLPGFGQALGYTLVYLSLLILLPLAGLILQSSELGFAKILDIALGERSLAALRVTFGASLVAPSINAFFGLIVLRASSPSWKRSRTSPATADEVRPCVRAV